MKTSNILLFTVSMMLLSSCNTDRFPDDQITPETFWQSEADVRLALNGAYSILGTETGDAWYYDGYTDNAHAQYPWESNATDVSAGNVNASTVGGYNFTSIRAANAVISETPRVKISESLKQRYIAEARALRAFNYFDLAYRFGDVPLVLTAADKDADVSPKPEAEIIKFVLKELDESSALLPVSYSGGTSNEKGRVTKGAVLAMKARIELYYKMYKEAAADAEKVMNLGVYQLFKTNATDLDYADKWENGFMTFSSDKEKSDFYNGLASYQKMFWKANEENSEFILTSQFLENTDYNFTTMLYVFLMPGEYSGWSSITPTQNLVNAYWTKNGTTFTAASSQTRATYYNDGKPNTQYFEEFKNRDTRLYASIMFPESPWNNLDEGFIFKWPKGGNNTSRTGYNFKKMVDPNDKADGYNGGTDHPLIRYAEVLLTYAEALNESSGPSDAVYNALDQIRKRVGMPIIIRNQSQATLRDIIRNERRIELANEGHRYFDIRRWNIAASVMHDIYDITNSKAQTRIWNNKFMKLPYPQSAVDRNPLLKPAQAAKGY